MFFAKIKTAGLAMLLIGSSVGTAQNFDYNLQRDSSLYTAVSGINLITNTSNSQSLGLKLPFSFTVSGYITDTVIIEPNGFLILHQQEEIALVALNSFKANPDSTGNNSASILTSITGQSPNRICKIQFSNFSVSQFNNNDFANYQIWLHENGNKISIHFGPNSYSDIPGQAMLIGLLNRNMDSAQKGFLLSGTCQNPAGQIIVDPELIYLEGFPNPGVQFSISPDL
jgi:hypothetical protein